MPEFRTQVPSLLRWNYPRSSPELAVVLAVHLPHSCPALLPSHSYRPQESPALTHEKAAQAPLYMAFFCKAPTNPSRPISFPNVLFIHASR